ncbi:MAG: hypothetical protein Q4B43_07140 [Bacteroidota bacterium]|nr:hypothetical protein [Bacteroidota bacterium]
MAQYEESFDAEISIFAFDFMKTSVKIGAIYKVFRGQEEIGWIKIRSEILKDLKCIKSNHR